MTPPAEEFTFETLTEVYRREQRNKTISEVPRDFYPAMRECLENLKRESEREFAIDQFSAKAKLASNQLMKFQEKSAQVFEFRFGKLMDMALRAVQGARLETTRLTIEEQEVYDQVYAVLKDCRAVVLEGTRPRVVEAEEPSLTPAAVPQMVAEAMREEAVAATPVAVPPAVEEVRTTPVIEVPLPAEVPTAVPETPAAAEAAAAEPPAPDHVVLRIVEDIPAFAGPGRTYRLQKEDLVSLPQAIARALIARKKAVGVQVSG